MLIRGSVWYVTNRIITLFQRFETFSIIYLIEQKIVLLRVICCCCCRCVYICAKDHISHWLISKLCTQHNIQWHNDSIDISFVWDIICQFVVNKYDASSMVIFKWQIMVFEHQFQTFFECVCYCISAIKYMSLYLYIFIFFSYSESVLFDLIDFCVLNCAIWIMDL